MVSPEGSFLAKQAVDKVVIKNWQEELPEIIAGYDMGDIFNCDETALFFKQPTNKSLVIHGDHGHGDKRDKSRVSLLLCTSWVGEKEKIMMIGASENPRALKGVDKSKLPVIYRAQKKSWMTGYIFTSWINDFDRRMKISKRRVLLFMDNAGVHNIHDVVLTNTKIVFFPKNTTSCLQPLDAGVIQAFKMNYRQQLHNLILNRMTDEATTAEDPYKSVNIALVIVWVFRAWRELNPRTISKCFARCGFHIPGDCSAEDVYTPMGGVDDDVQLIPAEMENKNLFSPPIDPEDLFDQVANVISESQEGNPVEQAEPEPEPIVPSSKDALDAIQTLQLYALGRGDEYVLGGSFDLAWYQGIVQSRRAEEKYQTKISDFFTTAEN